MANTTTDPPARAPLCLGLGLLHLSALGLVGFGLLSFLFTFLATGIALVPVFGIGVLFLVASVYVAYGIAWFETNRVSGLYRLDVAPLRVKRGDEGFKGYLAGLWRQAIDGRMWRAIASFSIASVLGLMVLGLLQALVRVTIWIITGRMGEQDFVTMLGLAPDHQLSTIFNIVSVVVIVILILLIIMLHRAVTPALIAAGAQESELRDRVRVTSEQREGAVRAADVERTRIERDLHDGVQPRLVSIGMTLGLAKATMDSDPDGAKALIDEAHTSTKAAVTELRQLARGIHASVLDDRGLDAALSALAGRSHIPVHLDVQTGETAIGREAQAAVYFSIAESLTNAAKHSRASECRVTVRVRESDAGGSILWARVEDNGAGGAVVQPGGGLDGIINRVKGAGGTTRLESPTGGPTSLEVSVPCAS